MDLTSTADIIGCGRKLLAGWQASADRGEFPMRENTKLGQLSIVHGLAAHAHRAAGPVFDLVEGGLVTESWPLVRLVYECGVTAMWAAQTDDGAEAIVNEMVRQRTAMARDMKLGSDMFRQAADSVSGAGDELLSTSSGASARQFQQRCADLAPGGTDAYLIYRWLSEYSHASAALMDQYVEPKEVNGEKAFGMRLTAKDASDTSEFAAFITASGLAWAGRAIDYFDRTHYRRSELRAAARELKMPLDLKLSPAAYMRTQASGKTTSGPAPG